MKRCFIIGFLLISHCIIAQPQVKLYGYSQVFVPGMVPQDDIPGENGSVPAKKSHVVTNYYLYIASNPAAIIQPREIWLNGKGFKSIAQQVVTTPVKMDYPEKKILVPQTKQKVVQLNLGDSLAVASKPSPTLKKLITSNQVVIVYLWKGKKYYVVSKKLIELPPVHGV